MMFCRTSIIGTMCAMAFLVLASGGALADLELVHSSQEDYFDSGGTRIVACTGLGCPDPGDEHIGDTTGSLDWEVHENAFQDLDAGITKLVYTVFNDLYAGQLITSLHVPTNGLAGAILVDSLMAPFGWTVEIVGEEVIWRAVDPGPDGPGVPQTFSLNNMTVTYDGIFDIVFAHGVDIELDGGEPFTMEDWVVSTVAIDEITGACCEDDGSCVEATLEACEDEGGEYQGDFTDCEDVECGEPTGACCLSDGSCVIATQEECEFDEGFYQGDDTDCDSVVCEQPPGACCLDDGSCVEVVEEECDGVFNGDGTICDDVVCEQPPGACCLDDGSCIEVVEEECDGAFNGDGTTCDEVVCEQPPGACCLDDGSCVEVVEEDCDGIFNGDGTICDDVVCEQPPGACCLDDGSCVEVVEEDCDGVFNGDSTICDDVVCDQPPGACCLDDGSCVEVVEEDCDGVFNGDGTICDDVVCEQPAECDLEVLLEGCVILPLPPTGGDDCQGKVIRLTLEYTGDDCDATNHSQDSGKVNCDGDPMDAAPVRIRVSDKEDPDDGNAKVWFEGIVDAVSDTFVIDSANGGDDHLKAKTFVHVFDLDDDLLQSIEFHTSCSQPLSLGDQFGSVLIVGMVTTEGGEVPQDDPPADECVSEIPFGQGCEGKVEVLTLLYGGEDCDATDHTQNPDKVSCEGDPQDQALVHILATDKENADDSNAKVWFEGDVALDATFDLVATNAGEDKLKSSTWIHVFDLDDNVLQTIEFHTSCSQPLNLGDQFGSVQVVGMQSTEGGTISLSTQVDYTVTITNHSASALTNVTVVDEVIGELDCSPIASIASGETVVCTYTLEVTEETTTTVTVTGDLPPDTSCEASASATITVAEPPESCCEFGKPRILTLQYTGDGCDATQHSQDNKKVKCDGDPLDEPLVQIIATDKKDPNDSKAKIWFDGIVGLGETFDIDAANAGENKLKKDTRIFVYDLDGNLLQTIKFHTSCSQPLNHGDQFGSVLVTDCVGEDEPTDDDDEPNGDTVCSDGAKPQVLTMQYTGEDCGATDHSQNPDKVTCEGDPLFATPVNIRASNKENPDEGNAKVWFEGEVGLDETFDIDATNAGENKLKAATWVHIFDASDVLLQTLEFHTSCSQPLFVGDQFGSLILVDFVLE